MKHKVQFITLEEDDKDLIIGFAVEDLETDVKSLILLRTLFYEELMDEEERGVKVSLEGDDFEDEDRNTLIDIQIEGNDIAIKSTFREYQLDISGVDKAEIEGMIQLLKKQNYDNRFTMRVA
jgi:hypothetical protein